MAIPVVGIAVSVAVVVAIPVIVVGIVISVGVILLLSFNLPNQPNHSLLCNLSVASFLGSCVDYI